MTSESFVPADFVAPRALETEQFRLEPLGPEHNESDLAAWSSSIEHIRATKGYPDGDWPPVDGMSLERNLADLVRHAADFAARKGFTFTVLDPGSGEVIGCVYLYPTSSPQQDVEAQSWVTASRAELDGPLADAVAAWLADEWPWQRPDRHGR
jgi:RimJ/RimL family protein N-acetyltransferase